MLLAALLLVSVPGSGLLGAPVVGAQPGRLRQEADDALQAGRAALQAGDLGRAIGLLEAAAGACPEDGRAWHLLGVALHADGEFELALAALAEAVERPPMQASARFDAARSATRLGRAEEALAWLEGAVAAGFDDFGRLTGDPELAPLHDDPRFVDLLPIGRELAFAEDDVRVLLELRGEAAGDRFGWIGRNAGDVDGDGKADLLLSAPFHAGTGPAAGRVYVYSSATGELLWKVDGLPGAQLGIGIERAGDVNGDGVPDQVAGAPGAHGTGAAYVYSGVDGELLREWRGTATGDRFGSKVAGAGDLDGDGHADVIVGAPYSDGDGSAPLRDCGAVRVFSGASGAVLFSLSGAHEGDLFGRAVDAHAGPGGRLLIVGASDAGPDDRGQVLVFRLRADGSLETPWVIGGREGDRELGGMFVSAVGDVDADGVTDVYASDWSSDGDGLPGCGRIYVHSGADGRLLHALRGETTGEGFGIGTAEAGDVDGDGWDDLLVGAWQHGGGATGGGKCTLFSGRTGAVLATYTCKVPAETFGFDTSGLGDLDGDGSPDFLITNADSFANGPRSGRVVVVAGPPRD